MPGEGRIELVDIRLMVLGVVNRPRLRIDHRGQRVVRVVPVINVAVVAPIKNSRHQSAKTRSIYKTLETTDSNSLE